MGAQFAADQLERTLRQALALQEQGRLGEAWERCRQALKWYPGNAQALTLMGVIAGQGGYPQQAAELFQQALLINPRDPLLCNNHGNALTALGQTVAALASFERAISLNPNLLEAHYNRANALSELKRFEAAVAGYDRVIAGNPRIAEVHYNRGNALLQLGCFEAAIASYARAIALNEGHAAAHNNLGVALLKLRRYEEAIASYERALKINAADPDTYNNRGNALLELERYDEALASYDAALALNSQRHDILTHRGNVLSKLRRPEEALDSYQRSMAIDPSSYNTLYNRGNVLSLLKRYADALDSYNAAIELNPNGADAYYDRGNVLGELKQHAAALASCDSAIGLEPTRGEFHLKRGEVLLELRQYQDSLLSFHRAVELAPNAKFALGSRLHARLVACTWSGFDADVAAIIQKTRNGAAASNPLTIMGISDSPQLQLQAAQIWMRETCPPATLRAPLQRRRRREKIRVGYFSGDFREHPVSLLAAGLFESHDRSEFEIFAFSTGPDTQDPMRKRLERAFDRFLDVRERTDSDIARLARSLEIDIAIDLGGYTQGARPGVLAARAAPLQINYLGYSGTMGAPYMDYLIADRVVIPEEKRALYREKVVYMPNCYMPCDSSRAISPRIFSREEFGLPPSGFVFCSFNNSFKVTPALFTLWMALLREIPGSVLWLAASNDCAVAQLRQEAQLSGVAADRLVFASRVPSLEEHLARHRLADLFLDSFPYNAHTTTSDALWAGLPVLTLAGESFASRVAASLLTSLGLPQLVTGDRAQYQSLAAELARNPRQLAELRQTLTNNRLRSPLFDTRLYTRHFEAALTLIFNRYQADLAADHIVVPSGANVVACKVGGVELPDSAASSAAAAVGFNTNCKVCS